MTDQAAALYQRTLRLLDTATAGLANGKASIKDVATMLGQVRQALELLGKSTGEIATGVSVQVIFTHPATRLFIESIARHAVEVCGPVAAQELLSRIEHEQRTALAAGGKR